MSTLEGFQEDILPYSETEFRTSTNEQEEITNLENTPFSPNASENMEGRATESLKVKIVVFIQGCAKLALWGLLFLSVFKLFFSDGGIFDYQKMAYDLKSQQSYWDKLNNENKMLENEILKIQSNTSYQKQLIRQHLGLIADDEFLILDMGDSMITARDTFEDKKN